MSEKLAQKDSDQEEVSEDSTEAYEEDSKQNITAAEEKSEQEDSPAKKILEHFDKALIANMENLAGTNQFIGELPINICTFSCIILIATRETEIESFPYLPPERYTLEKILEELADIGIEPGEDLNAAIEGMTDKEYMEIADDGRFFAKPPTISMSKLIDRIFPKMPGLNLFAYIGQMMDEVMGERKKIDHAISQFIQIMDIHGVPIDSRPSENKSGKKLHPHLKGTSAPSKPKIIPSMPDTKPLDIYSQLQTKPLKTPPRSKERDLKKDMPHDDTNPDDKEDILISEDSNELDKVDSVNEKEIKDSEVSISSIGEDYQEKTEISNDLSSEEHESQGEVFKEKDVPDVDFGETDEQASDDDIERRIAVFEEQLGITCPLCHTPGIKSRVTAKGKTFYRCSNEECSFISWGKPYYITCPRCNNPFLVETIGNEGRSMLKCPKATCPHWQQFPWEEDVEPTGGDPEPVIRDDKKPKKRRKVKRRKRRVVRRKR